MASCPSWSRIQYKRNDARLRAGHLPGARRHRRDLSRLRGAGGPGRALGRHGRADHQDPPADRRYHRAARPVRDLPGQALRHRAAHDRARRQADPRGTGGAAHGAPHGGQAAGGAAARVAHQLRHRDAARGGDLPRRRELLASPERAVARASARPASSTTSRPTSWWSWTSPTSALPQIGGMFNGDRARKLTLVEYGFRLPSALDNRPLHFDEFMALVAADDQRLGDARRAGAAALRRRSSSSRSIRPTGLVDPEVEIRPVQGPGGRSAARDPPAGGAARARAGHDAHQADVGGPHRLPAAARRPGALSPLGHRRHRARGDPARAPAGRVRRAGGHQPAAGGARPAGGVARRDPRCRPGGLPARRPLPDPDGAAAPRGTWTARRSSTPTG